MRIDAGRFTVRLAESETDVATAQRLRYRVFIEEMGATPSPEDAAARRERDRFDPYFEHLLLIDNECDNPDVEGGVVGVYRLLRGQRAKQGIGFYGASEYDLTPLDSFPSETLELGRSCVDAGYRGGVALHLMLTGVGRYVVEREIGLMFGVASFHGTDLARIAQALSYLHHTRLARPALRVRARGEGRAEMDILPPEQVDPVVAMRQIPALIKAYMRLGAVVGDGAYVDRDFNTVDICIVIDAAVMPRRYRRVYFGDPSDG